MDERRRAALSILEVMERNNVSLYDLSKASGYYALTQWHPDDVKTIRESWTKKRCARELARAERAMQDGQTEIGWDVLEGALPAEDSDIVEEA